MSKTIQDTAIFTMGIGTHAQSIAWGLSNSGAIHDFDPCLWIAPLLDNTAPVELSTVRGSVFSFDPRCILGNCGSVGGLHYYY